MEKWDVYDRQGNLTGRTKTREDTLLDGEYHLGVSLWIINSEGKLLIQKRAACKRIHPNKWSITSGAVLSGETSTEGCVREVGEEIGLHLQQCDIALLSRSIGKDCIFDEYAVIRDFPIEAALLQPEEVSDIKWATLQQIRELF